MPIFLSSLSPTPLFLPSGNPSPWTAILAKPTLTSTSKSTSPMSPVHVPRRSLLQSLPHHPQRPYPRMVHNPSALLHRQLQRPFPHVLHPFCWQPSTPTTTIYLLGIRQEQGEPLRAFIDRFSKVALRTPHLDECIFLPSFSV